MDYKEKVIALLKSQELSKEQKEKLESIFPELKESGDERIRKALISFLKSPFVNESITDEKVIPWIAWLEKQGDHANFLSRIQVGDKVTRNEDGVLVNLSQLKRVAKKDEKQGEQKPADIQSIEKRAYEVFPDDNDANTPFYRQAFIDGAVDYIDCGCKKSSAWSEEDEGMVTRIVKSLSAYADKLQYEGFCHNSEVLYEQINWLKSLIPQNTWKPSDAQMASITCAVRKMKESACYDSELVSLLNDLKKLRKE